MLVGNLDADGRETGFFPSRDGDFGESVLTGRNPAALFGRQFLWAETVFDLGQGHPGVLLQGVEREGGLFSAPVDPVGVVGFRYDGDVLPCGLGGSDESRYQEGTNRQEEILSFHGHFKWLMMNSQAPSL